MTAKQTTEYTCDLCGAHSVVKSTEYKNCPEGWITLVFEDKYVDRSFYEKHVCDSCAKTIASHTRK